MTNFRNEHIQQLAERINKEANLTPNGNVTLQDFVEDLGGTITLDYGDTALTISDTTFTIHIPFTSSPTRDTFLIAHNLGHYYIHYIHPKQNNQYARNHYTHSATGHHEAEANMFAKHLLMPNEQFLEVLSRNNQDITKTAKEYGLSPQRIRDRHHELTQT